MDLAPDARRTAFERVASEIVEPVRRFLARRTDPATADDVLGDVLLVLWRRFEDVPAEALPWSYGVARNCLANAQRSARRQQRVAAKIATVDPPTEAAPDEPWPDDRVHAAMAMLREEDAELLRLWAWEELGPHEIAVVLAITPNAVSIRLHRAREKLKDALRKIGTGAGDEQLDEGSAP